jgi:hypothetical protein
VGCCGFALTALEARWRNDGFSEAIIGLIATLLVILRAQRSSKCRVRLRVPGGSDVSMWRLGYRGVQMRRTVGEFLLELAFEEGRGVYARAAGERHVVVKNKKNKRMDN